MKTIAIIVAAGVSSRMGSSRDKIFTEIRGKPILLYSLEAFQAAESIDEIIVVTHPENTEKVRGWNIPKVTEIVAGGSDRAASVQCGMYAATYEEPDCYVAIHDGARPLITSALIDSAVRAGKEYGAAIPAIPVRDTVKEVLDDFVVSTPERESLFMAQTPQVFCSESYQRAFAGSDLVKITDDSMLVEQLGIAVKIVEGDYRNIKITTPEDLKIAEVFLSESD
jgi:2-C-methyl-D-erythritol 4-phosphate cytidylyltransferase